MVKLNQSRVERILRLYSERSLERYRGEAIYRPVFTARPLGAAVPLRRGLVVLRATWA